MKNRKRVISIIIIILIIISIVFVYLELSKSDKKIIGPAPEFTAKDVNGTEFSLNDSKGNVIILQIMRLDSFTCEACEEHIDQQLKELDSFHSKHGKDVTIITINMRFDEHVDTKFMVRDAYNVEWHLVDEYAPYPILSEYQNYWSDKTGLEFHNPTIILIDPDLNIVGVYHIDKEGVLDSETLSSKIDKIQEGEWGKFIEGEVASGGISFVGIFLLGIITALSPCSIALMIAMLSYVMVIDETNDKSKHIKKNKNKSGKNKFNTKKSTWSGFWIGVSFTLGMGVIFFIFGCLISYIGFFIQVSVLFYLIAGIILVVLGINAIKPLRDVYENWKEKLRSNEIRENKTETKKSFMEKGGDIFTKISGKSVYLGAFFLGILFSIGWAPCAISLVMPVLILMLTQKIAILMGGLLLFVFGIGHGVPIIPLCTFTRGIRAKLGNKYIAAGKWVEKVFGIAIIIIGIILMLRYWGINFW